MKKLFKLTLALLLSSPIFGQSAPDAQISFVYPLGTSGLNSINEVHHFSFNLLLGLNGGVNGFEFGSLLNFNNGSVNGVQVGGLSNFNTGNAQGFQAAGLFNFNQSSNGSNLAGLLNMNLKSGEGIALAGISNINGGRFVGLQMSGIFNAAKEFQGLQIGLINRSRELGTDTKLGFQLGLINIVDSSSQGYSLGLINIIKGGYYAFEISTTEMLYQNLQFKMGVEKLYSFLSAGFGQYEAKNTWGLGLGLGSLHRWNTDHGLAVELGIQHLKERFTDPDYHAFATNARLSYQYQIAKNWALSTGFNLNYYQSDPENPSAFADGNTLLDFNSSERPEQIRKAWLGLHLGFVFIL